MYKHILKVHGQHLAKEQALPQNDTADGNGAALPLSGTMGGVEIVARVAAQITLADTKTMTVSLSHSDDGLAWSQLCVLYSLTSDGGDVVAAGTELGRFVPPSTTKKLVKAVLATDDGAAAGSVDVFPHHLPR